MELYQEQAKENPDFKRKPLLLRPFHYNVILPLDSYSRERGKSSPSLKTYITMRHLKRSRSTPLLTTKNSIKKEPVWRNRGKRHSFDPQSLIPISVSQISPRDRRSQDDTNHLRTLKSQKEKEKEKNAVNYFLFLFLFEILKCANDWYHPANGDLWARFGTRRWG